jgi:hypothetical protein
MCGVDAEGGGADAAAEPLGGPDRETADEDGSGDVGECDVKCEL